uniref:Nore protein n=1 Tax=Brucella abortus TaxID=235 RepID=Q719I2_BRUAO|nr:nore protein [Brucella abortus]
MPERGDQKHIRARWPPGDQHQDHGAEQHMQQVEPGDEKIKLEEGTGRLVARKPRLMRIFKQFHRHETEAEKGCKQQGTAHGKRRLPAAHEQDHRIGGGQTGAQMRAQQPDTLWINHRHNHEGDEQDCECDEFAPDQNPEQERIFFLLPFPGRERRNGVIFRSKHGAMPSPQAPPLLCVLAKKNQACGCIMFWQCKGHSYD